MCGRMGAPLTRYLFLFTFAMWITVLPAGAVITRLYPLADVIAGADTIVVARITTRDTRQQTAGLKVTEALKGKPAGATFRVRLAGANDKTQAPVLLQRLKPGRTVILFGKARKFTLGYVEGTWFRLAEPTGPAQPWQFVHLEVYLRRTFRGAGAELQRTVVGVLNGKMKAPAPDASVKPGYGN